MSEKLKESTGPARREEIKRGAVEPEKPTGDERRQVPLEGGHV